MQKRTVRVAERARQDIAAVQFYLLAQADPLNTERVTRWLWRCIEELTVGADRFPLVHCKGVPPGIRFARVHTYDTSGRKRAKATRWVIFFMVRDDVVEVARVRHASQRPLWEE